MSLLPSRLLLLCAWTCGLIVFTCPNVSAAKPNRAALESSYKNRVRPFLDTHCDSCHGREKQKAKLDLSRFKNLPDVEPEYQTFEHVLDRLKSGEMPPPEAKVQPSAPERRAVIEWIQNLRRVLAEQNAGDPGLIPPRRLSNAEYDNTIRDLTGVAIAPAREFPVDPANQAGFDNSGESLTMSPALFSKYLEAGRVVASHLLLNPEGFVFAPHPVVTETDRDKYCVQRIIDFYRKHETNYTAYFVGAWKYKNRKALNQVGISIQQLAKREKLSGRYLETVFNYLENATVQHGPGAELRTLWRNLPIATRASSEVPTVQCEQMSHFIEDIRGRWRPEIQNLSIRGIAPGSQPFVLWKDRQIARRHQRWDRAGWLKSHSSDAAMDQRFGKDIDEFCRLFPDGFYMPERGLVFQKEDNESKGRLLSAGFHLMTGYFRDDGPLSELLLDETEQATLENLWSEFDFITQAPIRQYKDFIFFERAEPPRSMYDAEFDFARSEDKSSASPEKIEQLRVAYLAKARKNGGAGEAIEAIEAYFQDIAKQIQSVETRRIAAEESHLKSLVQFAERAHRRPLAEAERASLLEFYRNLREKDGLEHEEAMRDSVASILVSPAFLYRTVRGTDPVISAISPIALANRLSYFLWASMPDDELMHHARNGDLKEPNVLRTQASRLLRDPKARGLALEFAGHWLEFRRFQEFNSVDRERFSSFSNELRDAMFEEPVRFFLHVVQNDRSVLDFLYADYTLANPILARHYNLPIKPDKANDWAVVQNARSQQRGGLLPMSVFLTSNSPGLRTSPVKRGYWVVRRVLGEEIPPPPPNVPQLPADESQLGNLSLREMLEKHRADPSCAACHARFDAFGLAFENFDPVGGLRTSDLSGHPVDTRVTFPNGKNGTGLTGLKNYIHKYREQDFLENLSRKLLAYALGRTLIISDDALIVRMQAELKRKDYRFSSLIESIVTSEQFLKARRTSGEIVRH